MLAKRSLSSSSKIILLGFAILLLYYTVLYCYRYLVSVCCYCVLFFAKMHSYERFEGCFPSFLHLLLYILETVTIT